MKSRLLARSEVSTELAAEMFGLLDLHFEGVAMAQFHADLEDKHWVLLLESPAGRLQGFSTLRLDREEVAGEPATVVYSGDTIVDPEAWGSSVLAQAWIGAVLSLQGKQGAGRLYWLLLASGFRTYRFLPVFWREFYPRFDRPTPESLRTEIARLARRRFGASYDPAAGVVRFPRPQRLRGDLAEVPAARRHDSHVRFFVEANPGHAAGDELVCWADLDATNLTRAGWRMVRAGSPLCGAPPGG